MKKRHTRIAAGIIAASIIIVMAWYFSNILAYVLISAALSFIGSPAASYISRLRIGRLRIPAAAAASLVLLVMVSAFVYMFFLLFPLFAAQAEVIAKLDWEKAGIYIENMAGDMQSIGPFVGIEAGSGLKDAAVEQLRSVLNFANISNIANSLLRVLGDFFFAFFSVVFISFFFLKDPRLLSRSLCSLVPDSHVSKVYSAMVSAKHLLSRYFAGLALECAILMVVITALLYFTGLGFRESAVIGFLSGCFNIIPYVGPVIACMLASAIGFASAIEADAMHSAWAIVATNSLIVGSAFFANSMLLQPYIYSSSVKAHPLEIFLVILMAGSAGGIVGMIVAIPAYTLFRVAAKEFLGNYKFFSKLTERI
jgi:predicted PurR-regulated permease PerM